MKQNKDISQVICDIIIPMMDRVMNNVLIEDPFLPEKHHASKPLYAALVPDEIFKGSHFERRFVTPFGAVWEKLAQAVGENIYDISVNHYQIEGNIPEQRLMRITEILNKLEHPEKGVKRISPDWNREIQYIFEGKGELIPVKVMCDLYVENNNGEKYAFEIKAPLPNSDQTKVSKEKILKLFAMEPPKITSAFYSLPYNPYGKRENYAWSFPARWFDMKRDETR